MTFLRRWLHSLHRRLTTSHHDLRGFRVTLVNTRPEIDDDEVVRRLGLALDLIDQYTPHYGRHLRRDFSSILVERYPCRGAYFPETRTCLVELTFCVNEAITDAQIAATILHEGMHARLHALGDRSKNRDPARAERFCRRAEIEFGNLVPGGSVVVERAIEALALPDEDIAPVVDWTVAMKRVAQADLEALEAPSWLKRTLARRRGLQA